MRYFFENAKKNLLISQYTGKKILFLQSLLNILHSLNYIISYEIDNHS